MKKWSEDIRELKALVEKETGNEVTPENLRIRKRILDHDLRMKAASKKNK